MTKFSKDYLNDILVRMAYHNSAIEGNKITLAEAASILLERTTPSHKSIREFYEIENHKETFQYILRLYEDKEKLSIHVVKDIHSLLLDRLQDDKGQFKTTQNAIIGAEFKTASPEEIPMLMKQWLNHTNDQLEHAKSVEDKLNILAESHIDFERIHSFSDGNGRTGRMILMFQGLLEFGVPIVINNNDRAQYIELLANQESEMLAKMFHESVIYEEERMNNFL